MSDPANIDNNNEKILSNVVEEKINTNLQNIIVNNDNANNDNTNNDNTNNDNNYNPVFDDWTAHIQPCCCDHCLLGPNLCVIAFAYSLIIGHSVIFVLLVALKLHISIAIISIILVVTVSIFLFRASFMDPGIIPKSHLLPPNILESKSGANSLPTGISKDGRTVTLQYCSYCQIYKPIRTHHCRECGTCVLRFDHHCVWINNCVGLRNYRYFALFVFSLFILIIFTFITAIVFISIESSKSSFIESIGDNPLVIYLIIYEAITGFCISNLVCYHCHSITSNTTTLEDYKATKGYVSVTGTATNDVQSRCKENWNNQFCEPLPRSLVFDPEIEESGVNNNNSVTNS